MSSTTPAVTPAASGAPVTKVSTAGTASKYRPVLSKKAQAAPAPGVKNVRAAYSGKGWYVYESCVKEFFVRSKGSNLVSVCFVL